MNWATAQKRPLRTSIARKGMEPCLIRMPYESPSDFYLFRALEHWLRGKKFRTIEEMRQSLTEFFDSKDGDWYRRGIAKLEEQWQKVIESGGEYFDY
uniref:Histone-lysine N-methyltransferase SETMAR n=1 Tax=Acrobeloides nanus TaxID=290746 RepID=A0A914C6M7_9BILA